MALGFSTRLDAHFQRQYCSKLTALKMPNDLILNIDGFFLIC